MNTAAGASTEQGVTRRAFYLGVMYGLWAVIGAALAAPAVVYLFLPPKPRTDSDWVEVGEIGKLEPKVPVEMVFHKNRLDGWKLLSEKNTAWVVKLSDKEVVAFGPQCTHLGCAYHWDERKGEFICPCHSSNFSIDGKVLSGPAPRPLDRYETKVEKNKVLLGSLRESMEPTE